MQASAPTMRVEMLDSPCSLEILMWVVSPVDEDLMASVAADGFDGAAMCVADSDTGERERDPSAEWSRSADDHKRKRRALPKSGAAVRGERQSLAPARFRGFG